MGLGAGAGEIKALGRALARLPQRAIWKLTDGEIARAGGHAALNLTANIKVTVPHAFRSSESNACLLSCRLLK